MASDDELDLDDPEAVMREARANFITAFPGRFRSITQLMDAIVAEGPAAPADSLRRMVHQMVGIAGTIGLPAVSERASDLEQLLIASGVAKLNVLPDDMRTALAALDGGFAEDLARPAPAWAQPPAKAAGARIMIVEDDDAQRAVVTSVLRKAGYVVIGVNNGAEVLDRARMDRPALVLLDVDLPGADGFTVCRRLKSSPEFSSTPVIFMTTRAKMSDRLAGVALGGDDYLVKPVDQSELLLRIELLLRDKPPAPVPATGALTYEAFVLAAQELLQRDAASLVLIRLPRDRESVAIDQLLKDVRRVDVLARYDAHHVVWLMPATDAATAEQRLRDAALRAPDIAGGVAASPSPRARSLEALLADADEALNRAAAPRQAATVLLADDDPAIMRIVDSQLRAAGYRTQLVFDGAAAAEAAISRQPDLLVLDLMMPKRTGFDVLTDLRGQPRRPKVIVLSARGREEDVTRAFALGADDYMTKPFSPQELMARVSRLLR